MGYGYKRFMKNVYKIFGLFVFFVTFVMGLLMISGKVSVLIGLAVILAFSAILFMALISIPKFQCNNISIKLDRDMLMVSRRFLINLQSGMSIFSAYADIAKSSTFAARFFNEVVSKIWLGKPIEDAIKESIKLSPSKNFKKVQNQINSALLTGSDIEKVFKVTLDELTREHILEINNYGKKLGPVAMIYMIFGAVLPSLGTAVIIIILSVVLSSISSSFFTVLFFILGFGIIFIQFIFITIFSKMRPQVMI